MKLLKTTFISISIAAVFFAGMPAAHAQVTWIPHPFLDFAAKFVAAQPKCTNGLLVEVLAPGPLVLLLPFVPITPLVPIFKLWGPVPDAMSTGNFLPGGVCLTVKSGGTVAVPVMGMLVQIGTGAAPAPWYVPLPF
jgi:hypothetical protein